MALVKAFRMHGHLAARLDPLGTDPIGDPALNPATLSLTPEIMATIPSKVLRIAVPAAPLPNPCPISRRPTAEPWPTRSSTSPPMRSGCGCGRRSSRAPTASHSTAEQQRWLLHRLTEVETLERFLHKAYLGQKRFSIEGVDMLVPMLDHTIEHAAAAGAATSCSEWRTVAGSMSWPIRWQALRDHFCRVRGRPARRGGQLTPEGGTGDVKYHHGADGAYATQGQGGHRYAVAQSRATWSLSARWSMAGHAPSRPSAGVAKPTTTVPQPCRSSIHGDAAFAGQGVVAETLNLGALPGYRTGGTLHIITNNQVGFTTDMEDARSTLYASDLAKGFDIPIIHVNADDPEACLSAVRLAMAYRDRVPQGRDHRSGRVPPAWAQRGRRAGVHPAADVRADQEPAPVRELYAGRWSRPVSSRRRKPTGRQRRPISGWWTSSRPSRPSMGEDRLDRAPPSAEWPRGRKWRRPCPRVPYALNEQLHTWPEGFTVHPKLQQQLERRRAALGPRRRHRLGPRRSARVRRRCSPRACRSA